MIVRSSRRAINGGEYIPGGPGGGEADAGQGGLGNQDAQTSLAEAFFKLGFV